MSRRIFAVPTRLVVALAALVATGACASAPDYGTDTATTEATGAVIIVDNTNNTISDATVYLVPEDGVRQRLGTVSLGDRQRFQVEAPAAFDHRLLLDVPGSDDLQSQPFTLTPGDTVEWDLNRNIVNLVSGG